MMRLLWTMVMSGWTLVWDARTCTVNYWKQTLKSVDDVHYQFYCCQEDIIKAILRDVIGEEKFYFSLFFIVH